jgi:hypothetical protein
MQETDDEQIRQGAPGFRPAERIDELKIELNRLRPPLA